jgi:hypothetical protein
MTIEELKARVAAEESGRVDLGELPSDLREVQNQLHRREMARVQLVEAVLEALGRAAEQERQLGEQVLEHFSLPPAQALQDAGLRAWSIHTGPRAGHVEIRRLGE